MTEDNNDLSVLPEVEDESNLKIDTNRFRMLCDNVQNCFFEIDKSMFEILELKDKLLLQYLPRNVALQITLVLSRFYRAYSQSQVPVYELIRLVQIYSEPFDVKCSILKRLYDSNETKKRMLNLAFQKLTSMDHHTQQYQEQKSIDHWEKMYVRLALPRANIRKWKFRIKTFREKAELGYEHVIAWIHPRIPRSSIGSDISIDDNQLETSSEIINIEETNRPKSHISNDSDKIDSIEIQKSKSAKQEEPIITKVDIEIQVQPDFNDEQTSTDDILSTKWIIMRIYRPIGIAKTKFYCIIHAQGYKYTTKMFTLHQKSTARVTPTNRTTKTKKQNEVSKIPDNIDINKIDKQQTDEFRILMPNVLKRHSLLQTDIDMDAIKIDVFADEILCGSLILSSEDLRMLDLPNLSNPKFSPFISLEDDDDIPTDFDQSSTQIYNSWLSHTPHLFSIYDTKHEVIGKLPLTMFWYNKLESTCATKSTMTIPVETRVSTPKIIPKEKIEIIIPTIDIDQTDSLDNHIEVIKASYENEIAKLHENYQTEIHRLTNLLNKIFSNQILEASDFDEIPPEIIQQNFSTYQTKSEISVPKTVIPTHNNNKHDASLPFLDRYEMYLQRSIIHRHQLTAKIEYETALANERLMEFQHRLHRPVEDQESNDDLCLPAVFMPFQSGNVINPRAYQYFHSVGSAARRLTQAPSIVKFPSLPSRSVSVLNLFELSRTNDKTRPTTQASD